MTFGRFVLPIALSLALAGCAGSSSLTTGSLFGGGSEPAKTAAPVAPEGDATSRAFQVGSVSARAVKCGYNFDPATLKSKFLAAEAARGSTPDMIARAEKIYGVAYNGVWKGVAAQESYCSSKRTKQIKADLNRHLAGDYSPSKRKIAQSQKKKSGGFASWFTTQP